LDSNDPDTILRGKIAEFVERGEFGLASGLKPDGTYERVWYNELFGAEEVAFESNVYLLTKEKARALKSGTPIAESKTPGETKGIELEEIHPETKKLPQEKTEAPIPSTRILHLSGTIPPEIWNRLGTKLLPKLRSGMDLKVGIDFSVTLSADIVPNLEMELRQILEDLGLSDRIKIEK